MKVRPCAEFATDLPDDHLETEFEITRYGGENVAKAIAEILVGLGCEVDPPVYAQEHGWELDIRCGKRRLWAQVTQVEDYIFVMDDPSWIAKMLSRRHPAFLKTLTDLAEALAADGRFHNVRWYFNSEVLSGAEGAPRPVEG